MKKFAIVFSIVVWAIILIPVGLFGLVIYKLNTIEKDTCIFIGTL
ncbi:hypothetical protein WMO40_11225 [Bacillaceae bacterium CLA-AA-H227]|uniref:Uncharacterized protein n=1 Tax=Robertmurraya yapensis (ex Hitch et al 2024) TaxID=3133160 RepID=A0ACC6SB19_9BACI